MPQRSLKAEGADKGSLAPTVAELVALKAEFESATGTPFDPPKKTKAKKPAPAAKEGGKKASRTTKLSSSLFCRSQTSIRELFESNFGQAM